MHSRERRWPRIDLALDVTIQVGDLEQVAQTLNVSREGLFVRTVNPRPVGTRVHVCVALSGGERFHAEGVVIHTHPDPDDPTTDPSRAPGMGVFLTASTLGWHRLCDRLERQRDATAAGPKAPPAGRR